MLWKGEHVLLLPIVYQQLINNGDIVEKGTHEELLAKKGAYEKLYNSQFNHE